MCSRESEKGISIYIYIYTYIEKIYGLFHGERWINWLHVSTRVNYRNRGTCACKLISFFFCTLRFLHDSLDFPFCEMSFSRVIDIWLIEIVPFLLSFFFFFIFFFFFWNYNQLEDGWIILEELFFFFLY